jgi:cytochrome c oxidase subunit 2
MNWQVPLFPEAASAIAPEVDLLYLFLIGVSVFFSVGIAVAIVWFCIKYRRRSEDEIPPHIHGNNLLEITWSVIPLLIALVMFFWGARVYFEMRSPPADAMEILVTGKQWMWKLQHPNGKREINELHLPVDQAIKITMTSEDVIHSFFIPAFRVKQDAVPGKYTQMWFTPTKIGTYHLFCAEYCGTEHSRMAGSIHVMSPSDYEAWLGGRIGGAVAGGEVMTPAKQGEALFGSLGCVACHNAQSNAQGPNLVGVFGTEQTLQDDTTVMADENYIRESILTPQAKLLKGFLPIMPTYQGMVTEPQLLQILAYIKSLGVPTQPDSETP